MNNVKKNKKIGIIGGVGPQATSVLYNTIISLAQKKYDAAHNDDYPHVVIESVPIPDFISDTKKMDTALNMLQSTVQSLEKAGATTLCIASNTVHLLLPELEKITTIPFLSMVELVAKQVYSRGLSTVGLVSSNVTLKTHLYQKTLEENGITLLKPTAKEATVIDTIIRYVLAGKDNGRGREEYITILQKLFKRGAQAVILGCTELPLAINYEALGDTIINSMQVLAEAVVDQYYT